MTKFEELDDHEGPDKIIEIGVVPVEEEVVQPIEIGVVPVEEKVVVETRPAPRHAVHVAEGRPEAVEIVEAERAPKPHRPAADVVETVGPDGAIAAAVVHDEIQPVPIVEVKEKHHGHHVVDTPVKHSVYPLQENVDVAREELGLAIENLMATVTALNPVPQVKHCVDEAKQFGRASVTHTIGDARAFFGGQGFPADAQRAKHLKIGLGIAGGLAGLIGLKVLKHAIKDRHQTKVLTKAARIAAREAIHESHPANNTVIETGPIFEVEPVFLEDLPRRGHRR